MKSVYLCGPMEGVDKKVMTQWRDRSTKRLAQMGISTRDPCRRKAFHDEAYSANLANRIVKMDLQDIAASSVILANLTAEVTGKGKAWGSMCEIAHGHTKNKIIVVVKDEGVVHPFLDFYATEQHTDLEAALQAVENYYL